MAMFKGLVVSVTSGLCEELSGESDTAGSDSEEYSYSQMKSLVQSLGATLARK